MLNKGYEFQGNFAKHKFVYPMKRRKISNESIGKQYELLFTEQGKIYDKKIIN